MRKNCVFYGHVSVPFFSFRFTEQEEWRANGKLLEEKLVGRAGNGPKVEFLKLII
jgi:hypothetical protein